MELSLRDLVARCSVLRPSDAVAVGLAVASHLPQDDPIAALSRPPLDNVLLTDAGDIVVVACDTRIEPGGEARWLALIVYGLLGMEGDTGQAREPVPGGLVLLLARALGESPLPPLGYPQFLEGLAKFGSANAEVLSAIHARCASADADAIVRAEHSAEVDGEWVDAAPAHEPPRRRSRPLAAALAIALVVAAAGVGAWMWSSTWRTEDAPAAAVTVDPPPVAAAPSAPIESARPAAEPRATARVPDSQSPAPDPVATAGAPDNVAIRDNPVAPREPTPSPDGRRLMFLQNEPGGSVANIWVSDAGGAPRRLTSHSTGQPAGASWFPSGDRIVYAAGDTLVMVDVADGRTLRVKSPIPGIPVRTPTVSSDEARVVFQAGDRGVWTYELATGELRRVEPTASNTY